MLMRRTSQGAPANPASAGPVSSTSNGSDSSAPVGATTNVLTPSSLKLPNKAV